eukprot:m.41531 g.41531  ORF g.41531 m.41531 type:complete len:268 (+) comp18844_c0_seq1:313-1116(+)
MSSNVDKDRSIAFKVPAVPLKKGLQAPVVSRSSRVQSGVPQDEMASMPPPIHATAARHRSVFETLDTFIASVEPVVQESEGSVANTPSTSTSRPSSTSTATLVAATTIAEKVRNATAILNEPRKRQGYTSYDLSDVEFSGKQGDALRSCFEAVQQSQQAFFDMTTSSSDKIKFVKPKLKAKNTTGTTTVGPTTSRSKKNTEPEHGRVTVVTHEETIDRDDHGDSSSMDIAKDPPGMTVFRPKRGGKSTRKNYRPRQNQPVNDMDETE